MHCWSCWRLTQALLLHVGLRACQIAVRSRASASLITLAHKPKAGALNPCTFDADTPKYWRQIFQC